MPPTSSHGPTPKPSALLAVVCLAIVHRLYPEWTAISLADAGREVGVRPERLSRLATRCIGAFESVLASLTRIGRPSVDRAGTWQASESALLDALLEVASAILHQVSFRRAAFRDIVVGSFERLVVQHASLTLKRFAAFLGIPERTLRDWRNRSTRKPAPLPSSERPPDPLPAPRSSSTISKGRSRTRRPRFGMDVTLPDTQYAGDTTDLAVCGVPLKMMAAQDIGGRDLDLLDDVIIDTRESSEQISRLLQGVLSSEGGEQVHTDQGTPFMAGATRAAIEELNAEHAPQVEGDPCGKATIERAFRTVKDIARPLFELTNRLAATFPALANPELAKLTADLIVRFLLRAYQAGARAAWRSRDARGNLDLDQLARAAQESRELARVTDESARLLLTRVHETLDIPGRVADFIRHFRYFPIAVLQRAESAFAAQAHRSDIGNRYAYFASLAHNFHDEHKQIEAGRRAREKDALKRHQDAVAHAAIVERRRSDPASWFFEGLQYVACHWIPQLGQLLFDGIGAGTGHMRAAFLRLVEVHGTQPALDIARGVIHRFVHLSPGEAPPESLDVIATVATTLLAEFATPGPTADFTPRIASAILGRPGSLPRPGPLPSLRT